ncbi:unnamed protein product [Trifolium pratense]|uniref:Uncharacterized protein n=1 Tax=Trifolium pratense TaxID=57577 RepID=A0ACB0J431_TRIPR|nr:unnamed protein product [Trifolium pratense]
MQRKKNMVKILKFVYALTIFLSLILLVTSEVFTSLKDMYGFHCTCIAVHDCPKYRCNNPFVLRCIWNKCYCM